MSSSSSDRCLSRVAISLLFILLLFCQFLFVSLLELLLVSDFLVLVTLLVIFALLLCLVFAVAVVVNNVWDYVFCSSIGVNWVFHLQDVSWFFSVVLVCGSLVLAGVFLCSGGSV